MSVCLGTIDAFHIRARGATTTTTFTKENSSNYPQTRKKVEFLALDQKFSRHFSWFSRRWFFLLGSREGRRMRSQREGQHFYSKRVFSFDWRDLFLPCKSDWQRPVDPLNCDKKRWGVGRWSSRTTRNQWRGNEINHLDRGHCQKKEFVRTRHLMMDFPDDWTLGYWNSKPSANPIVWSASIDSKWISWDNFLSSLIWVNIFISGTMDEMFSWTLQRRVKSLSRGIDLLWHWRC